MNVLITGAAGFIGRYVVTAALRRGHRVRAVVRSAAPPDWYHPHLEVVPLDLQTIDRLSSALAGVEVVVHLAAALTGSPTAQWQGTVGGTQALLTTLRHHPVGHFIAISTFSVYDYRALSPGAWVTETTPLEPHPTHRDGYTQAKLAQEALIRQFAQDTHTPLTVLRPGIVYGRDRLWTASLGVKMGDRLWICIGDRARLPLLYVEHGADAIVQAIEDPAPTLRTLNLVDDDLPTQAGYVRALQQAGVGLPPRITLPWAWVNQVAEWVDQMPLATAPLPGLLRPARVQARFKLLNYSNALAKQTLNWQPRYPLQTALTRAVGMLNLLDPVASEPES